MPNLLLIPPQQETKPLHSLCPVGGPALSVRSLNRWYIFIYKAMLGLLPFLLRINIYFKQGNYCLGTQELLLLSVPKAKRNVGKIGLNVCSPVHVE